MIFGKEMVRQIELGKKSQTRRLMKGYDISFAFNDPIRIIGVRSFGGKLRFAVGRTYAVQPGRGKKSKFRICLTGIRLERLRDISEKDAMKEGFVNRVHFLKYFYGLYDYGADWNPRVWVLEFKKVSK